MLGLAVEARQLKDWFMTLTTDQKRNMRREGVKTLPTGWSFLGAGVSRYVFLSPTGVAYKVGFYGDSYVNQVEHDCAAAVRKALRKRSDRVVEAAKFLYIPKTRMFSNGVLAMEYINGDRASSFEDNYHEAEAAACSLGIGLDFHPGNGIEMKDGRIALIDMGFEEMDEELLYEAV